jgi:hypothetical protein
VYATHPNLVEYTESIENSNEYQILFQNI